MWALHGLQFLQGISICSSPVLSRGHSVYIFCPWITFLCFFTDLEVHTAFSSPFFPSLFYILVFFLASSICFQTADTSFSDAHCALWVHLDLPGSIFCLVFCHRGHPAALPLPTLCHKLMEKQTKAKHNPTADLNGMDINNLKFVFDVRRMLLWSYRSVNM